LVRSVHWPFGPRSHSLARQDSLDLTHHRAEELFFQRKYLRPIMLVVAIAAFNQLSGINVVKSHR